MVDKQLILDSVGPVQAVLDAHDGVVNVVDTTDGVIMISLEGGCTGCSATPMTAMQIYYSLMKLDEVEDVVFVNGELPAYMRAFIDDKLNSEWLYRFYYFFFSFGYDPFWISVPLIFIIEAMATIMEITAKGLAIFLDPHSSPPE